MNRINYLPTFDIKRFNRQPCESIEKQQKEKENFSLSNNRLIVR